MTPASLRSMAAGLLVLVGACGTRPIVIEPQPRSFTPQDYGRVYEAWTRSADEFAFGRLEDILHVTATFEAWEFRWAYVIRYAEDYALDTDTRAAMLRASLSDARKHHRFFVTMVGNRFRESDLTKDRSAWRVLLVNENGDTTSPVGVEKVRPVSALERMYFPSTSVYRHAFRIVFPTERANGSPTISPDASRVRLRFTGALGTVDLAWELDRPSSSDPGSGGA